MTGLRIGHGYDVHRLVEGRKLILGGVEIPLGAGSPGPFRCGCADPCGDGRPDRRGPFGDIGKLFPDTDPACGVKFVWLILEEGGSPQKFILFPRVFPGFEDRKPHRYTM